MTHDLTEMRRILKSGRLKKTAETTPPPIDPSGVPAAAPVPVPPPGAQQPPPPAAMPGLPPGLDPSMLAGLLGGAPPAGAPAGAPPVDPNALPPGAVPMDPNAMPPGAPPVDPNAPPMPPLFPAAGDPNAPMDPMMDPNAQLPPPPDNGEQARRDEDLSAKMDQLISEFEALKQQLADLKGDRDEENRTTETLISSPDLPVPEDNLSALDLTPKVAAAEPGPVSVVDKVRRMLRGRFTN